MVPYKEKELCFLYVFLFLPSFKHQIVPDTGIKGSHMCVLMKCGMNTTQKRQEKNKWIQN